MRISLLIKITSIACVLVIGLAACDNSTSTTQAGTPAAGQGTSNPGGPNQASIQMDISYGPLPQEVLDLCTPQNSGTTHPGVILIHGGSWTGGEKSDFDTMCSVLAERGFVAATINYRLAPRFTWPNQLVDSQLAVRWLRAHANQYGLDPQRLCSLGSSVGGQLAVFLGVLSTIHPGDQAGLLANQSPKVSCVVDEFGPVDLTAPLGPASVTPLHDLFGGATLQSDPAVYRDASPIFDVSAQSAPTLIIQGSQDQLVYPAQSQELFQALQRNHVPVKYISYDGGHGFSGLTYDQEISYQQQAIAFLVMEEHPDEL